ncbi:MAG TPA: DUF1707 domain-containing protein [Streptosporangiaceae bacterium]|nr:DUF1707 domain-containing protein [Streptosporangiaceae bacterium]
MATGADWRAGDAEREDVAGQLREHYAAGRLTIDEFRARLDAAYSAATARDLGRVSADLPVPGRGPAAGSAWEGTRAARRRRAPGLRRRWAGPAGLLIFAGLVTASVLALGSLPHGGLLVLALLLVLVPVTLLAALAGALVWIGLRAWRSGAWLEALPIAAGMPWLGRVVWLARAVLVGRAFWRAGERVSRPLRSRHGRYHRHGYAHYQRTTGGPWHQARVGDLSGTTR